MQPTHKKNTQLRTGLGIFVIVPGGGFGHELLNRYAPKYSRPRLADKHSLCSSCIPAPAFESFPVLQNKITRPYSGRVHLFLCRGADSNRRPHALQAYALTN